MTDLYRRITDAVLHQIETAEPGQWVCPWHRASGGLPRNALSGRAYRGINILSLWCGAQARGFADARWATYRQWVELGAQVRKGEHGTLVLFYKDLSRPDADADNDRRFVARASVVFNAAQVVGAPELDNEQPAIVQPLPVFEQFVERTGAIVTVGDAACYIPAIDEIRMPSRERFRSSEAYCSTLAHELVHWTGAKSRLDRELSTRFKTQAYAAEELVAELGAAFTMAQLGIAPEPHPNHAHYMADWLPLLQEDSGALVRVASLASKAAEYLAGCNLATEEMEEERSPNEGPLAFACRAARSRSQVWMRGTRVNSHGW